MSTKTTGPVTRPVALDQFTPAGQVAAFIDRVKQGPAGGAGSLLPLLSERHSVYRDRPAGEAVRLRGYAMAAFERTGLPDRALPYVLESLESDFHPYMAAAAARALRGMSRPHPEVGPYLIKAVYNIWEADNPVSFATYHVQWPQKEFSTGLSEIFETLGRFGGTARRILPDLEHLSRTFQDRLSDTARIALLNAIDAIRDDTCELATGCCELPVILQQAGESEDREASGRILGKLAIQDQEGNLQEWGSFFRGKPAILAFFYTRCGNPRKCVQTVFNLTAVRDELESAGLSGKVRVAAITYDSQFDTAEALKSYGTARRFRFDEDTRMFRVPEGFEKVVSAFNLGVNFIGTQVNSHRIELYLLDAKGDLARSFLRIQSDPRQVVEAVAPLLSSTPESESIVKPVSQPSLLAKGKTRNQFQSVSSVVLGFLVAFFPKCPVCWASYMSVLGVAGTGSIPYSPWLLPVIVLLLSTNLYILYRRAARRNGLFPFWLSTLGSLFLLLSIPYLGLPRWLVIPGLGLLLTGSSLQALSFSSFNKLKLFFSEFRYRFFQKVTGKPRGLSFGPRPSD